MLSVEGYTLFLIIRHKTEGTPVPPLTSRYAGNPLVAAADSNFLHGDNKVMIKLIRKKRLVLVSVDRKMAINTGQ